MSVESYRMIIQNFDFFMGKSHPFLESSKSFFQLPSGKWSIEEPKDNAIKGDLALVLKVSCILLCCIL